MAEGVRIAERLGHRLNEARLLDTLALIDPERSERHLERARVIFTDCGCLRGLAELAETERLLAKVSTQR